MSTPVPLRQTNKHFVVCTPHPPYEHLLPSLKAKEIRKKSFRNLRLLPLSLAVLLSGCGFHLRGTIEIPCWLTDVSIICNNNTTELMAPLKYQLTRYKVGLSSSPQEANYWLIIENSTLQKQVVSIGSSTNPRQYQLILMIEFSLQTKEGEPIISHKKVVVTRQLTINNDRILGSNDEERIFKDEMKEDAVTQIMNRLASVEYYAH